MIKRILIATDGSRLSRKAITHGIALAKALGATVVGFHARQPFPTIYFAEAVMIPPSAEKQFEADSVKLARERLAEIETAAKKALVDFKAVQTTDLSPAEAIIRAAKKEKCDLIVMSSHGRKGFARVLIGSETNLVLTHSNIPVLVTR
ncbi:MAG: universal stress protein [Burkholderiales bacterium]